MLSKRPLAFNTTPMKKYFINILNIFENRTAIRLPGNYQLLFLLFFSGFCGFFIGAGLFPNWQVSVEAGQIIAGIVQYPSNTIPQYMCLIKTWSVLNQISAFLLYTGFSEAMTSLIISGIIGAISFQAVTVLFFSVSRNILLSLTIPFFICFMSYVGFGVVYPILFMESPHSFGRIGLVFVVLIIGLLNSGYIKTGSFLLGIAPCVHPSFGSYCVFVVFIVVFFYYRTLLWENKRIVVYFLFGVFITFLSFIYQYSWLKGLPSLNALEKSAYIASFIKYWDYHRSLPFNYLSPGFLMGILGAVVSFIVIRFRKTDKSGPLFVFRLFIVSFMLSAVLSLITYLPTEILTTLHILMPGRYINLNNIMFMPLLLGLLATKNNSLTDKLIFSCFILTALGFKIFLPQTTLHLPRMPLPIFVVFDSVKDIQVILKLVFMVFLPFPLLISMIYPNLCIKIFKNGRITDFLYRTTVVALLFLSAFILSHSLKISSDKLKITDPALEVASTRKGMLLLSTEAPFPLQIPLRRPTPIDPGAFDGFLIAPESGPILNNLIGKIYGLNIFTPPFKAIGKTRNSGTIPCVFRKQWEARSVTVWLTIRNEFGVTDILTPPDWHLQLPVVIKGNAYALYTIPDSVR